MDDDFDSEELNDYLIQPSDSFSDDIVAQIRSQHKDIYDYIINYNFDDIGGSISDQRRKLQTSEETYENFDMAFWLLFENQIVYKVNAQVCFEIFADKDLNDYIMFDQLSNVKDTSLGINAYWVSTAMVLSTRFHLIDLISATISIEDIDFDSISDSSTSCTNGLLPNPFYVPQTMCLDMVLVLRNENSALFVENAVESSSKREYLLQKLSDLILDDTISPFAEYIESIDITASSGSLTIISSDEPYTAATNNPTTYPTPAPTLYRTDLIQPCSNSPCDCSELNVNTCHVCHTPEGCDQCMNGYFKPSYSHQCQNCQDTFGDGCIQCQDFHGCGQCKTGYLRLYDSDNDLYYCEEDGSTHVDDDWRFDTLPTCQCPYKCENEPCSCGELEHCKICHYNGCNECETGYFKKDYNTPCLHCQDTFGDSCKFCQDFNGCGECKQGYNRVYDSDCGLHYCE